MRAYHRFLSENKERLIAIPETQYEMLITIRDMYSQKLDEEGKNLHGLTYLTPEERYFPSK